MNYSTRAVLLEARARGCAPFIFGRRKPRIPGSLLLDVDHARDLPGVLRRVNALSRLMRLGPVACSIERSPSGRGFHVVVVLPVDHGELAIIGLQAIMGSDPWREAHNMRRALGFGGAATSADCNVLFQSKRKRINENV